MKPIAFPCSAAQVTFSCPIEYIWKFKPPSTWVNNGLDGFRSLDLPVMSKVKQGVWQAAGGLHAGEAEALVLARQKKADWFLTDDAATRLFVSMLGIEVHGSLGIVLWSAAKRHITRKETEEALNRLEQSSLWLSKKIYEEAREALDDMYGGNK